MKSLFKLIIISVILLNIFNFSYPNDTNENIDCYLLLQKNTFSQGEPINVKFFIKNISNNPFELIISEKFYFNFTFILRDMQNRVIKEKREFLFQKEDSKDFAVDKNIKTIGSGDYYGKEIDLSKIYDFTKPGFYIVQGFFYPIPYNISESESSQTPLIKIYIKDEKYEEKGETEEYEDETEKLVPEKELTPWETIEYTLQAKIDKEWTKYFQFMDLERLIKIYDNFASKYKKNMTLAQKQTILKDFKEYLKIYLNENGEKIDSFKILRTMIDNEKDLAVVEANLFFLKFNDFVFGRHYTFYLYRKNKQWFLYEFTTRKN